MVHGETVRLQRASPRDGGRSWITLATFPRQIHSASPEFDISRYASSNTVIAFVVTGGANHVSYIDDVRLTLGYEDPPLDPVSEGPDKGGPPDHADPRAGLRQQRRPQPQPQPLRRCRPLVTAADPTFS